MDRIGGVGFTGFKQVKPASTGRIVNSLEGVQNAVGSLFEQYNRDLKEQRDLERRAAERAENQRRWEIGNSRDQALYDLKMGEANKALQDRAMLQTFDPQGVEGTRAAWNNDVARDTSEGVGNYLEAINREASQASPEKLAQMVADKKILQTEDGSIIPFVNEEAGRSLKSYLDGSITKESAAKGYANFLRGKDIDPATAREEGKLLSENEISRKDILDAEEKQTKYINENKKHNLKQLIEQGKLDSKFYNPTRSKSSNKTSLKGYAKDWNEFQNKQSDYDVSAADWLKWGNAGSIERMKDTAMKLGDITPAALDKALNDSIVRNRFGDNFGDLTEDEAVSKILKLAKSYDTSNRTGYSNPQSRRIVLDRDNLVTERSFNEIMKDRSDSAVENFRKLMRTTSPVATSNSAGNPPTLPRSETPPPPQTPVVKTAEGGLSQEEFLATDQALQNDLLLDRAIKAQKGMENNAPAEELTSRRLLRPDEPYNPRTNPYVGSVEPSKDTKKFIADNLNLAAKVRDNYKEQVDDGYATASDFLRQFTVPTGEGSRITKPKTELSTAQISELLNTNDSTENRKKLLTPKKTTQSPIGRVVDALEFGIRPEDNPAIGVLKNEYPTGSYVPYSVPASEVPDERNLGARQVEGLSEYVGSNKGLAEQVIKEALLTGDRGYQDQVMQAVSGRHPELVKKYFSNFYDTSVSEMGAAVNKQAKAMAEALGISENEAMRMVMEEMVKDYKK